MKSEICWKLLIATTDESEAGLVNGLLNADEIPCKLEVHRLFPGAEYGGKGKEFRVYVDLKDYEASQQIIEDHSIGDDD